MKINNDCITSSPTRKIDIKSFELLMKSPIIQTIPKGFYTIEEFVATAGISIRAVQRKFSVLNKLNKLKIIKIQSKSKQNCLIMKNYYKILD